MNAVSIGQKYKRSLAIGSNFPLDVFTVCCFILYKLNVNKLLILNLIFSRSYNSRRETLHLEDFMAQEIKGNVQRTQEVGGVTREHKRMEEILLTLKLNMLKELGENTRGLRRFAENI